MEFIHKEFLRSAFLGLIVADALGVPYEFMSRDTFKCTGMSSGGAHNQPRGTWSDDTSMAIATLDSFIECDKIDYHDIMRRFVAWTRGKEYCPHGEMFDIGGATSSAISKFMFGTEPLLCGGTGERSNGNGSLMRILPLAFIEHSEQEIFDLSALTHAHPISKEGCRIYIELIKKLFSGEKKENAVASLSIRHEAYERIPTISTLSRNEIKSTGYVVDSLEAAIWCFLTTDNYRDCVITAVELGDDTDTVAEICGALAGLYYGESQIPIQWINALARKRYIISLINKALK